MATKEEQKTALSNAVVDIANGRIAEWREGDKFGRFINVKDATQAILNLEKAEDVEDKNEDPSCGIGFIL